MGKYWKYNFTELSRFLLIVLWIYAAMSKLVDFPRFEKEMHNQVFYPAMQTLIIWTLPLTELATACLLSFPTMLKKGIYTSLVLMVSFTFYIVLGLVHAFKRVPCSCGGILENFTWGEHLVFNLLVLTLILFTIIHLKKKGDAVTLKEN